MSEANPAPPPPIADSRSPEQHAAVRRRALPVAVGGFLCALAGLVLAWITPVGPFIPPSFLAMNLSFSAMLIGAGIFFYAKPTPGTRTAVILCLTSIVVGMAGTIVYTRQAVQSRTLREQLELENVTAIAQAANGYARDHAGTYPANLLVLLEEKRLKSEALRSPLVEGPDVFADFDALTKAAKNRDELLEYVTTKADYTYVAGDLHSPPVDAAKDIMVAYSRTTVLRVSWAVSFADGTARYVDKADASATMKACNDARVKIGLKPLEDPDIIKHLEETPEK